MKIFSILSVGVGFVAQALGQGVTLPQEVTVLLKAGSVEVVDPDGKKRTVDKEASAGEEVKAFLLNRGESLQTSKETSCDLVIPSAGTMRLQAESGVKLPATPDPEPKKQRSLELLKGKLFLDVDAAKLKANKQQFRLKTPTTIMAVKGTRFFAATKQEGEAQDTAGLHEGSVIVHGVRLRQSCHP